MYKKSDFNVNVDQNKHICTSSEDPVQGIKDSCTVSNTEISSSVRKIKLFLTFTFQGDSGGPLVVQENDGRYILAGIISLSACGYKELPGVYTRVSEFRNWINSFIDEESFQKKSFVMNTRKYSTFVEPV